MAGTVEATLLAVARFARKGVELALEVVVVVAGLAVLLVVPGFALLYFLQQRRMLTAADTDTGLRLAAQLEPAFPRPPAAAAATPETRVTTALVLAVLAIKAIRELFSSRRRR